MKTVEEIRQFNKEMTKKIVALDEALAGVMEVDCSGFNCNDCIIGVSTRDKSETAVCQYVIRAKLRVNTVFGGR